MQISIQSDITALTRRLSVAQSQHIPRAIGIAITRTAGLVAKAEEAEIRQVFDRPNLLTQKAVIVRSYRRATFEVRVFLRDEVSKGTAPAKYLLPQIVGGARPLKRFERALQRIGAMPQDMVAVPGRGAKYDAYGNMSKGQIVQILSALRAFQDAAQNRPARIKGAKRKRGQKDYFSVFGGRDKTSHLKPGVYSRSRSGAVVLPVLRYVKPGRYRKIFDFVGIGERIIRARAPIELEAALRSEISKAIDKRAP